MDDGWQAEESWSGRSWEWELFGGVGGNPGIKFSLAWEKGRIVAPLMWCVRDRSLAWWGSKGLATPLNLPHASFHRPPGRGGNTHGCAQVGEETWARPGWLLARCIAAAGVTLSHHPRTRGTHGSMPPTTPIRQPLGSEVAATVVVPVSASGRSRFCPLNSPGFSQASAPGVAFIPPRDPNPPTKSHSGVPWVATGLCPKINPRNYGEGGPLAFSAGPFEQPCAEGRAKSQRGCPVAKPP